MRVRRLGWAGLEIESAGTTVLVDAVGEAEPLRSILPAESLLPAPAGGAAAALVTHLHSDHADPAAIARALAPDGVVFRPFPARGTDAENVWTAQAEAGFAASRHPVRMLREWESVQVGPFDITAVPSVDGLGDPQLNWVVAAGGHRIFHGGDTVFHGSWWRIAHRLGPFDAAFLPVNGASVDFPHLQPPSPLPAVLTPQQAAVAAAVLRARLAVPIHYGIQDQPRYLEVDDPAEEFARAARQQGVPARLLAAGETLDMAPRP